MLVHTCVSTNVCQLTDTHLLEDLHQNEVELVDEGRLAAVQLLVGAVLDDQVADVVFDALPLLSRQRGPPELDDALQDLRQVSGGQAGAFG